jgi:hypothetical protein
MDRTKRYIGIRYNSLFTKLNLRPRTTPENQRSKPSQKYKICFPSTESEQETSPLSTNVELFAKSFLIPDKFNFGVPRGSRTNLQFS